MNTGLGNTGLQPLPIRPGPIAGETVDAYVRRLARANHLRPSYLRRYLSGQSRWAAALEPGRLAILSGRSLIALRYALPRLDPPASRPAPSPRSRPNRCAADKPVLFAAIRHDAQAERLSERALAARYHVHPRTIKQAMAFAELPPRTENSAKSKLDPLRILIEAMLAAEPAISAWSIWEKLTDGGHIDISYSSVRTYISKRRHIKAKKRPAQECVA